MERRGFSSNGKSDSKSGSTTSTSKGPTTFNTKSKPPVNKRRYTTDYGRPKRCRISPHFSQTDTDNRGCYSPLEHDPTPCQTSKHDEVGHVTGAGQPDYTCTEDGTATTHTNVAECKPRDGAWSPTTTGVITPTSTPSCAPTTAKTTESWPGASMPRGNRLKDGSGPDIRGRDSPVQQTVHWPAGIGVADAAKEAVTAWCGAGAHMRQDSRLNVLSRIGPRPSLGGDDTYPFLSHCTSSMTDPPVDCLPMLFLAYCTMTDPTSHSVPDDRSPIDTMTDDPVPDLSAV